MAAVAAVGVALLVAWLGVAGSSAAVPVGLLCSGTAGCVGGAVALRRGLQHGRRAAFRSLLGAALLMWGCWQLLLAASAAAGSQPRSPVDLPATAAALVAVAGVVLVPRRGDVPWQAARLALEGLMISSAAACVLWRGLFRPLVEDPTTTVAMTGVLLILAELTLVSVALVAAVRDVDAPRVALVGGLTLWVVTEVATLYVIIQPGGVWPWQSAAVGAVAWTLVAVGVQRITPARAPGPASSARATARAEMRGQSTVTAVFAVLVLVLVTTMLDGLAPDPVSLTLTFVVVGAFISREVVSSRQAAVLIARLADQAQRDALTGLANRWALTERLAALGRSRRPVTVLTLDLDGFKNVNGVLGHVTGDRLLSAVARRLSTVCPAGTEAFRLGGDEFAVLVDPDPERPVDAVALAHRLRRSTRDAAASVAGVDRVALSTSIGVASSCPAYGDDPARALTESASALRRAKQAGRDRVEVYTAELAAADLRRATIEQRLGRAVENGAVEVHFQPVVELGSGRPVGVEALARWTDAELGEVPPAEFVEAAESAGLMAQLGAVVLRRALAVAGASGATAAGLNVAVNVSALQLRASGFTALVADALHAHGTPPHRCVLEVTESSFVGEGDAAVATLHDLADLGVVLAVDDFGTGYSSLSYLDRLPFHVVKVDRSLTRRLGEPRTAAVAGAVVRLARELGMDVVLEGIETAMQERAALALGAQYGQGWLWSPAVPPEDVPALLGGTADRLRALPSPER